MKEQLFFEELPEGYECVDVTKEFDYQHKVWRKKTKKQRMKMRGLYGIAYLGQHPKVSTGLLRFIAMCIFYKKKGFIITFVERHGNKLEYVRT